MNLDKFYKFLYLLHWNLWELSKRSLNSINPIYIYFPHFLACSSVPLSTPQPKPSSSLLWSTSYCLFFPILLCGSFQETDSTLLKMTTCEIQTYHVTILLKTLQLLSFIRIIYQILNIVHKALSSPAVVIFLAWGILHTFCCTCHIGHH